MTPALKQFAAHLTSLGVDTELAFTAGAPATLSLPEEHAEVGPLTVYDEPNELTVEVGRLHHSHFATPREAADFVADLIAGRICVTVDFLGDRCIGSSYFALDAKGTRAETLRDTALGLKGGTIRSLRYLWSGPVPAKQT